MQPVAWLCVIIVQRCLQEGDHNQQLPLHHLPASAAADVLLLPLHPAPAFWTASAGMMPYHFSLLPSLGCRSSA
jgi:hypothetical protein